MVQWVDDRGLIMTKKDYQLIAAAINGGTVMFPPDAMGHTAESYEAFMAGAKDQAKAIAETIANRLSWDNPRFDRARFLKACGLED